MWAARYDGDEVTMCEKNLPGANGGADLVVEDDTLAMAYESPEDRLGGLPYTFMMLEEDNGSLEAV